MTSDGLLIHYKLGSLTTITIGILAVVNTRQIDQVVKIIIKMFVFSKNNMYLCNVVYRPQFVRGG